MADVKTDQGYQFSYHGVQGTHKIQLLTYSCNVQRAVEVELSLKSKRESERTFLRGHLWYRYSEHTNGVELREMSDPVILDSDQG